VMKQVGKAVRDYTIANGNKKPIVAIGIATWGCISSRDQLVVCISDITVMQNLFSCVCIITW